MTVSVRSLPRLLAAVAVAPVLALAVAAPSSAATPFPETVPLPDRSSPEGIAGGPGTTFFAGSRADGSIVRGDLRTGTTRAFVPGRTGGVAVGMQYDPGTGLLWVAGGATGTVSAYDGRTGALVARYQAPPTSPRFLNDVDVTKDGVFVTDSMNAALVVIRTGPAGALPADAQLLPLTGDWVQTAGLNGNGIRALPGGDLLVVNQGALLRVDPATGVATRLVQTGGPALTGGDGLVLRGSTLYVVTGLTQNSVAVVKLSAAANSFAVTADLTDDQFVRPTTATFAAGALWAVNGKFTQPDATTFEVVRLALH
jgi:hypothetical protein